LPPIGGRSRTAATIIIDIEGGRAAHRKMKTMTKKSKAERGQIIPFAKSKSGSRDPVAVAAVLKMLG
jgi:hypothetical protein